MNNIMQPIPTPQPSRDALFDNVKAFLIVLVVIGHFYGEYMDQALAFKAIYLWIYSFHMPLFAFVSGFFSKNVTKTRQQALSLLKPYLVFNTIWHLIDLIREGDYSIRSLARIVLVPNGAMWFLLALMAWRLLLPFLAAFGRKSLVLLLAVIAGLGIGLIPRYQTILGLSRIVGFLPFFMAGFYMTKDHIQRIRKLPCWIAAVGLPVSAGLASWLAILRFNEAHLFLATSYQLLEVSPAIGVFYRLLVYLAACLMSLWVIQLIPSRASLFTTVGQRTMVIYLGHMFIRFALTSTGIQWGMSPLLDGVIILMPLASVVLLSLRPFDKAYQRLFRR